VIYFAGRGFPFERIGSIIKQGNSILVYVDINQNSLYGSGWIDIVRKGISESCTFELEIQTKEVDKVFTSLEQARLSKIKF
jgi:hypothetical protein